MIGFNGLFETLNLGAAETQGVGSGITCATDSPILFSRRATLIWTRKKPTISDISQPQGARLPRRPRNEVYFSASYLWCKKLRTTVEAKFVNAREEINFGGPNFDIEDYSFVNFAAEYDSQLHTSRSSAESTI